MGHAATTYPLLGHAGDDDEFDDMESYPYSDGLAGALSFLRTTRPRRAWMVTVAVITGLLVLTSVALANALHSHLSLSWRLQRRLIPDFPSYETRFERQAEWEFGAAAHDLWAAVIPNGGVIALPHSQYTGLPPGLHTSQAGAEVYGLVVTHEYHCLRLIRESVFGLVTRDARYLDTLHVANTSSPLPSGPTSHLFHCINYLRRMILCRADTTLEWPESASSAHIEGYGPPHQCRNWDAVKMWMAGRLPPDPKYHRSLVL